MTDKCWCLFAGTNACKYCVYNKYHNIPLFNAKLSDSSDFVEIKNDSNLLHLIKEINEIITEE